MEGTLSVGNSSPTPSPTLLSGSPAPRGPSACMSASLAGGGEIVRKVVVGNSSVGPYRPPATSVPLSTRAARPPPPLSKLPPLCPRMRENGRGREAGREHMHNLLLQQRHQGCHRLQRHLLTTQGDVADDIILIDMYSNARARYKSFYRERYLISSCG